MRVFLQWAGGGGAFAFDVCIFYGIIVPIIQVRISQDLLKPRLGPTHPRILAPCTYLSVYPHPEIITDEQAPSTTVEASSNDGLCHLCLSVSVITW